MRARVRTARGLAGLFEFEEFEQEFEEDFEIRPDTLRPFGWRRMTESGLERGVERLRVALHSTKWILEGGAGGRTVPRG